MITPAQETLLPRDRIDADARVMTGCDELGTDRLGVLRELAELQPVVAAYAGVGRASPVVLGDEVVDHAREVVLEVQHVQRDFQRRRHPTGVGGIENGTASLLVRLRRVA